jgi:hypothetical protein
MQNTCHHISNAGTTQQNLFLLEALWTTVHLYNLSVKIRVEVNLSLYQIWISSRPSPILRLFMGFLSLLQANDRPVPQTSPRLWTFDQNKQMTIPWLKTLYVRRNIYRLTWAKIYLLLPTLRQIMVIQLYSRSYLPCYCAQRDWRNLIKPNIHYFRKQ